MFGNEHAKEQAIESLRKVEGIKLNLEDRRVVTAILKNSGEEMRLKVRQIIRSNKGYVDSDEEV